MSVSRRRLSALLALLLLVPACRARRAAFPFAPAALPSGEAWVEHMRNDLMPFWMTPEALGKPFGNFPTFRCDDGRLVDPQLPCGELLLAGPWVWLNLERDYTRMKSRQVFFYGAAYHLTGDPRMLEMARAGVAWIRSNALERDTGSAISYWRNGRPGPPVLQRTSQDLAYAALGLAFYYYLTREAEVLEDVLRLKEHVFVHYGEPSWSMLRWAREGPGAEVRRQELVAQLDQVNAYMLLLTPILPEPHRGRFRSDLARLCHTMIDCFWAKEHGLFWGSLHDETQKVLGSRHTDFGHTIKALWMIERAGRLLGDEALVRFANENAPAVLKRAFIPSIGCWASGVRRDGTLDHGLTWWISAELDQAAATLALRDPRYTGALARTYACWFDRFVDPKHGEVWSFVDPDDAARHGPKQHLWKSGYHSAEHALVAYVTTQELKRRPAVLHFALDSLPPREALRPYFFEGEVANVSEAPLPGFTGRRRVTVSFRGIR